MPSAPVDLKELEHGLRYISESPPEAHGGFHLSAVNTAKDALVLVCALRLARAALAKEMKERCPLCAQGIGYTGLAHLVERSGYNIDGCGAARLHAALRSFDALVTEE